MGLGVVGFKLFRRIADHDGRGSLFRFFVMISRPAYMGKPTNKKESPMHAAFSSLNLIITRQWRLPSKCSQIELSPGRNFHRLEGATSSTLRKLDANKIIPKTISTWVCSPMANTLASRAHRTLLIYEARILEERHKPLSPAPPRDWTKRKSS